MSESDLDDTQNYRLVGYIVLGIMFIALAFGRIAINVDLADEGYYALFYKSWLKFGISASPLRDIHATAALLAYPAVKIAHMLLHGDDGMLIVLRSAYLVGSLLAALSVLALLGRVGAGALSWLAGAAVLAFIPFGLPAPSYNTLGLQGEVCGFAWFGLTILATERGRSAALPLILSACGFTVAAIAYPTLTTVPVVLIGSSAYAFPQLRRLWVAAAAAIAGMIVIGWTVAVLLFTLPVFRDILAVQRDATSSSLWDKISLDGALLVAAPRFAALCAAAAVMGVCRPFLSAPAAAAVMAGILLALGLLTPTLFMLSHDAVFVATLMGLGLLADLSPFRPSDRRCMAILYAAALAGGITTTMTTSNVGLLNFAVGGAPAAVLAVLPLGAPRRGSGRRWVAVAALPAAVLLTLIGWSSFTFRYGDLPNDVGEPRERLARGPFAGLLLSADQAALIRTATTLLNPPGAAGQTLAIFGRNPGLYLVSSSFPLAQRGFYLDYRSGDRLIKAIHDFYRRTPPDRVAIFDDPYLPVVNPMVPDFAADYVEDGRQATPTGHLTLYRRSNLQAAGDAGR